MAFCTQCGTSILAGSGFCSSCGAKLLDGAKEASFTHTPETPAKSRRSSKGILYGVIALAALALGYLYATPYIAMRNFKEAVDRKAYAELSDAIDYSALKRSLAQALQASIAQISRDEAEGGGRSIAGALGDLTALTGMGIEQVLDKLITPEGVRQLSSALEMASPLLDGAGGQAFGSGKSDEFERLLSQLKAETNVSTGYVGLNDFEVRISNPKIGAAKLLFGRHGLTDWRLSGVDVGDALPTLARRLGLISNELQLAEGAITKKNLEVAKKWARLAVDHGLPGAPLKLSLLLFQEHEGKKPDLAAAIKVATMAADGGDADAAVLLSRVFESGFGVPADMERAAQWRKRAYEIRPRWRDATVIARMYSDGRSGLARNLQEADLWLSKTEGLPMEKEALAAREIARNRRGDIARVMMANGNPDANLPPWMKALMGAEIALVDGRTGRSGGGVGPVRFGAQPSDILGSIGKPIRVHRLGQADEIWNYEYFDQVLVLHFNQNPRYPGLSQIDLFDFRGSSPSEVKQASIESPDVLKLTLPILGRSFIEAAQENLEATIKQAKGSVTSSDIASVWAMLAAKGEATKSAFETCPIDAGDISLDTKQAIAIWPGSATRTAVSSDIKISRCNRGHKVFAVSIRP